MFSILSISIVFNSISFSMADEEIKAAPSPKLTAVLIPSIELSCKIIFNCFVSI